MLETVGRIAVAGGDGEGQPYPGPFTAHPKVDPRNGARARGGAALPWRPCVARGWCSPVCLDACCAGELFYFGYSLEQRPYVRGGMMDAKGTVRVLAGCTLDWARSALDT